MKHNNLNIMFCLMLGFMVVGCTDRVGLANKEMQSIREQPAQPIQPPPKPQVVEAFNYNAYQLRSPFLPLSLTLKATQEDNIQGVRPDPEREKEPLEAFELNQLVYRGNVISTSGEIFALIQTPDGQIARVKVGNYLGKNHGKITNINLEKEIIELTEIVPNSRVGFVNQSTNIQLSKS